MVAARRIMRAELGYDRASMVERMLIDHLAMCWLRLQVVELGSIAYLDDVERLLPGRQRTWQLWQDQQLVAAQTRYLRALTTLQRLRTKPLPPVQVNLVDRQLNVLQEPPQQAERDLSRADG